MLSKLKKVGVVIIIFIATLLLVFFVWAFKPMKADSQAYDAAFTRDNLQIDSTSKYISIKKKDETPIIGLIYYPGARVEAAAYVNKLSEVAIQSNVQVFITKPFANFAFFGINDISKIIEDNENINTWYIGGHSLGGAMACEYLKNNQEKVDGLLLFGSYCASNIKEFGGSVLSISGSRDALSTPQKINEYKSNLPESASVILIEGANHSQMGNYGLQPGDNESTVSDDVVKSLIADYIKALNN